VATASQILQNIQISPEIMHVDIVKNGFISYNIKSMTLFAKY